MVWKIGKDVAIAAGFTHNATYCGIQLWARDTNDAYPTVEAKTIVGDFLLDCIEFLELAISMVARRNFNFSAVVIEGPL